MEFYCTKVDGSLLGTDPASASKLASLGTDVVVKCSVMTEKKRTLTQNAAMHKYFELLAKALNDAGYDMRRTLKEDQEIPWTKESVKEHLWRPIQKVMEGVDSTAELTTADPGEIYATLSRHLSSKLGINVEWPSRI